ncbi:MAG TPA: 5-methyltetrahydropteroyltriglutamate--homocysteine S-methyltransferase, partial [Dermatophilaceae bacterium]
MTHLTAGPAFPTGTILGYPRIGRRRELKKAVEAFWAGSITAEELETSAGKLRSATRERLALLGLGRTDSSIPESFSYYDQVLDAAVTLGAVPSRFASVVDANGRVDLAGYF